MRLCISATRTFRLRPSVLVSQSAVRHFSNVSVNSASGSQANLAALDCAGILADPYEEALVTSTLRRRYNNFMMGLEGSTHLTRLTSFKAKDFNANHGNDILRKFYTFYGAQDLNGLKNIVTSAFYAKLKTQLKDVVQAGRKGARAGRRQNRRRKKHHRRRGQAQLDGDNEDASKALGFHVINIPNATLKRVRTIKGLKESEVLFGQATSEMEVWLAPVAYKPDRSFDVVPFQPPFQVKPCPGRWRRAVDDDKQVLS